MKGRTPLLQSRADELVDALTDLSPGTAEVGATTEGGRTPETAAASGADSSTPAPERRFPRATARLIDVAVLVGFELVFGLISVIRVAASGQRITFDLANYQYYSGFAEVHGFASAIALPGDLATYLDPQINSIYYELITHFTPRGAVAAIAVGQSLSVAALAFLVWRLARSVTASPVVALIAGTLAGFAALFSPLYRTELGGTASDAIVAVLLFAGTALLYPVVTSAVSGRAAFRNAALGGILVGLAGELKLTEAAYAVAILIGFGAAVFVARSAAGWSYRHCVALAGTAGVTATLVGVGLYLPEGIMLWSRYRDPFFPLVNGVFHSPYLQPGGYNPGFAAHTPASLWFHFSRLLVGGSAGTNGMYEWKVESPLLFFALVAVAALLVLDLIKRDKPQAIFLEISFLGGWLAWAAVFGYYRYLAPLEMASVAVVVSLLAIHTRYASKRFRREALLVTLVCAVALGSVFGQVRTLGAKATFGQSFFGVNRNDFSALDGAGVVIAGSGPLGFLVPYLPANVELVRAGGGLEQVVNNAWWTHVAGIVGQSHRPWYVVSASYTKRVNVLTALSQIDLPGALHSCALIPTSATVVRVCRVTTGS